MESLNRAFLYGESVFTTMRMSSGKVQDWDLHFDRLRQGIEYVFGPFSEGEDWAVLLKHRMEAGLALEGENKVIRLTVYRHQEKGLRPARIVSVTDLKLNFRVQNFEAEPGALRLRSCPVNSRPKWWPSFLKSGTYLETILAQKIHLQENDDDLLYINHDDTVLESSVANIFIVKDNRLFTAPTGPNVLEGVMRKKVLGRAREFFEGVVESQTSLADALKADAVFGTNSIRGVFLIKSIDEKIYEPPTELLEKIELLKTSVY